MNANRKHRINYTKVNNLHCSWKDLHICKFPCNYIFRFFRFFSIFTWIHKLHYEICKSMQKQEGKVKVMSLYKLHKCWLCGIGEFKKTLNELAQAPQLVQTQGPRTHCRFTCSHSLCMPLEIRSPARNWMSIKFVCKQQTQTHLPCSMKNFRAFEMASK